mgnify:CR=1 FL=1
MVGSGASDRSKEAVGMMALHEALRSVCLNTDWTYSVFWTIRPRPYVTYSHFLSFVFLSFCVNQLCFPPSFLGLICPLVLLLPSLLLLIFFFDVFFNLSFGFPPFLSGGSEVAMVAKLVMTMVACKCT